MAKKKKKMALSKFLLKLPKRISRPVYTFERPVPMLRIKRTLSENEEFQIMKLVLDKFLWIGTGLFGWGIYVAITSTLEQALYFILSGIVVMFLFAWIIVKEFEHRR